MAHFQQKEAPNHLAAAWNHPLGPPKLKARCRQICKPAPSGPSNSCLQYPNSTARWSPQMSSRPVPVGPQKSYRSDYARCSELVCSTSQVGARSDLPEDHCFLLLPRCSAQGCSGSAPQNKTKQTSSGNGTNLPGFQGAAGYTSFLPACSRCAT